MSITPISDPLVGERVIGLSPRNATEAAEAWLRRPNIFPGRALTAGALAQSQAWQAGHLAERGQDWVAGVVVGLETQAEAVAGTGFAAIRLRIAAGRGLAPSGEDVVLQRPLECLLADVPVVAPPGFFVDGSGVEPGTEGAPPTLRPRAIGATLGALAAPALAALPPIGVLVLQPVTIDSADFDAMDPCDRSACDEGTVDDVTAFEDWRIADAVRLLWFVWPGEWRGLPAVPAPQLRNALAWTVFQASEALAVDEALPWDDFGVPVALAALDATPQLLWLDRASVVRQGGRARDARLHLADAAAGSGPGGAPLGALAADSRLPSLWQARIEQFAEQIAAAGEPAPAADVLADAFGRFLPPVGLIPKNGYDPAAHASGFFPSGFDVDAAPVPVEQLDLAVRASAPLAPLDLSAPESVRILVPVPLASWEPRLLQTEVIDPEFQRTLDDGLLRRARTLGLRQGLRNQAAMLAHALNGQLQTVASYKDDPLALEAESLAPWGEPPPGGGHRSALRAGLHQHFFDAATTPFLVNAGESLFVWVCLDPDEPPRTLMLQWHLADGWEHRAYWGEDLIKLGTAEVPAGHYRAGDLPTAGEWVMLTVPADKVDLAAKSVDGMGFVLYDGRAAYGLTGARTNVDWRKWFCNFLPLGARVQGDEAWDLLTANDLWAPFEPRDGVVPSLPELAGPASGDIFGSDPQAPGSATLAVPTSGFNLYYPAASGWRGHYVLSYTPPLTSISSGQGDKVTSWLYLDELKPPRSLWAYVLCNGFRADNSSVSVSPKITFWGENRLTELYAILPFLQNPDMTVDRGGALPQSGTWTQLDVPLPDMDPKAPGVTRLEVVAILFLAFDGNLAFSDLRRLPGAAGSATEMMWPKPEPPPGSVTVPPYAPYLNAKLVAQNNLGVLTPTPSSRIGTVRVYTEMVGDPLIRKLSGHEQSQLLLRGLGSFADYLRTRIDRADDITDFGFAHMQVDIYRIRQLTMSTSDASRLAISPTLAAIAKSDSALVVQSQIADYISAVKASALQTAGVASDGSVPGRPGAGSVNVGSVPVAARPGVGAGAASIGSSAPATAMAMRSVHSALGSVSLSTQAVLIAPPRAPLDIVYSSPVIGASEIRTTAIADRLRRPPSPEARDYALANRQRTVTSLIALLEQFAAEDSGEVPALFVDFDVIGLAGDPFLEGAAGTTRHLTDFLNRADLIQKLAEPPPLPTPVPGANSVDEATLFTQAVSLSDITIAMLRQLEARLSTYRDALGRCETALGELNAEIAAGNARLQSVEDDLAEARYDVSVTRSLLAEETERIASINARRARVLADEVKFLAFIRPRETDNLLATPTHSVDPGLVDAPVPACLRQHPDTPDQLADMLRVVREAPANWFVALPPVIRTLDRIDQLVRLLQSSQLRAYSGLAMPQISASFDTGNRFGASIARVASRQVEAIAPRLAAVRGLDLVGLATTTWQGIRVQAEQVVSFADLAEGGHGRADAAQAAATELENIRGVVTCLHAEFSGVLPLLRLEWAETLSEFDAAPNLRNLASLSRWAELAVDDRRRMQAYVDWLFDQVEPGQPQAVALVNDVVRMCLLLASHAPVDRIVAGRMARPLTGIGPGLRIPLSVATPGLLRVGMQALMYRNDLLVARALVEDLGQTEVSARVIQTAAERVDLGDDVRVHFDDTASVSLAARSATRTLFAR